MKKQSTVINLCERYPERFKYIDMSENDKEVIYETFLSLDDSTQDRIISNIEKDIILELIDAIFNLSKVKN